GSLGGDNEHSIHRVQSCPRTDPESGQLTPLSALRLALDHCRPRALSTPAVSPPVRKKRTLRLVKTRDGYGQADAEDPRGVPLSAVPEARALVSVKLKQTELGQFGLDGSVGYSAPGNWHLKDRAPTRSE